MTEPKPLPAKIGRDALRHRLHEIIFEADTFGGKVFDVMLFLSIIASVFAVMLESVEAVASRHGTLLRVTEWIFTIGFTIEYLLRLGCVRRPLLYARSFYGIVDLLAILPTWITLLPMGEGAQSLLVIRALRLLRVFRVFKLAHYLGEASELRAALVASRRKILVFLTTVLTIVLVVGSLMYLVEGPERGFTSIPRSVYWAIVTMTTVGYGDIAPTTVLGQSIASVVMVIGYGIIAVPTGIVTAELTSRRPMPKVTTQCCPTCGSEGHDPGDRFCRHCGGAMEPGADAGPAR